MNRFTLFLCPLILLAPQARGADLAGEIVPWLTDDVVAVAYFDLEHFDAMSAVEWADKIEAIPPRQLAAANRAVFAVQQRVDELVDFGARRVYLPFRVSDFQHGGPTWIVPIAEGGNPPIVQNLLTTGTPDGSTGGTPLPLPMPGQWTELHGAIVGTYAAAQLELLQNPRQTEKRELPGMWETLGEGTAGLVIFGNHDSRRVVRELFPQLPPPLATIDGKLFADDVTWGGLVLQAPPRLNVDLAVQMQDESSAQKVNQTLVGAIGVAGLLPHVQQEIGPLVAAKLVEALTPQVEANRVTISSDRLTSDDDLLRQVLAPAIRDLRRDAERSSRINQLKQIALAFLNYEDSQKVFPPQALSDAQGKPLLSWRVLILPYLGSGEAELYKEFHLDEPWDSEHNRPLIARMPAIYSNPEVAERGKTTFMVPTGPSTFYDGTPGKSLRDVIDGTSNTLLVANVLPEKAVEWTKPSDWEVDFGDPWRWLVDDEHQDFSAAVMDGSVRTMNQELGTENLDALITPAGGEIVEW